MNEVSPTLLVRPATPDDIQAFAAGAGVLSPTMRAVVGKLAGKRVALGGLAREQGRWFAFLDLKPEARPYKMHIMRWAHRIIDAARRDDIRHIYAEPAENEPGAIHWLGRLGFLVDERFQTKTYMRLRLKE